jgi:predicted phage gp36 major capsid-like protein
MIEDLDVVLKQRVRAVLAGQPCTEAELRQLFEEGRACARILDAQLTHTERELDVLDAEPDSSIAELAAHVRRANTLRPQLAELESLLEDLEAQARNVRASWVGGR